jgi:hypothetical protein
MTPRAIETADECAERIVSSDQDHSLLDLASAAAARAGAESEWFGQAWRRRAAVLTECVVSTAKVR